MLSKLFVRNYAIIEALEVSFSGHLNIITGETGAGKSILVGALGLVLGDRADSTVLRDDASKTVVEALFTAADRPALAELLSQWDLEACDELLLRREVAATGKSRAFINDTPVNLSQLQAIASRLVDMHQQFHTLDLARDTFQRAVLDAFCAHADVLKSFRAAYQAYTLRKARLEAARAALERDSREMDYYRFLCDELRELSWGAQELEELEAELRLLSHADQTRQVLTRICFDLSESDHPLVHQLKTVLNQLQSLGNVHPALPPLAERLSSAFLELRDLSGELRQMSDGIASDPRRMDEIASRIAHGQRLMKKHGVRTSAELLELQASLEQRVAAVVEAGAGLEALQSELQQALAWAEDLARQLSEARNREAPLLAVRVGALLHRVGMPNAALRIECSEVPLYEGGLEEVRFLFDANRSGRFEPLSKVASGGELSRLMLSIKSLVAGSLDMPTLIYDEIDAGISGEAARQVGILMKDLASRHQVLSITHQPQIASRADAHFHVYKEASRGGLQTRIRALDEAGRVDAIAQMMGGENPSAVVLKNARELIAGGPTPPRLGRRR
ncbi:MAG: DNA repair protein RecN [Bacteroidetes bacterium]|nr:DNA repair protein RecN [Bacteroidota bacterium]